MENFLNTIVGKIAALISGVALLFTGALAHNPVQPTTQAASAIVATAQNTTSTSTITQPTQSAPAGTVVNNYITQPVIERTVQTTTALPGDYVTEAELSGRLTDLSNVFARTMFGSTYPAPATSYASGGIMNTVALMGRIDHLSGTSLTGITVSGVSGLTTSDIPDLSGTYLPLSGGTLTAGLVMTNATSTNFFATYASTTNATSTNLFATLGHFTTGIIDTLTATAATITNLIVTTITGTNATFTNATTTNATSTNLYVSGATTLATTTISNFIENGPEVDVRAYGAKGDGSTNDTAAFNAAIASLGTKGGTILVPPGKFAINIVITNNNIQIKGNSSYVNSDIQNSLVPYDPSLPVIQVGNDTRNAYGVDLSNVAIYASGPGGTGTTGLYLAGGAYRGTYSNVAVGGFTQWGIRLKAGSTYPTTFNQFNNILVVTNNTTNTAGIGIYYPATGSYTTANYFTNVSIASPTGGVAAGYALEIDSAYANFINAWLEVNNHHGINFLDSYPTYPPVLYATNVEVDSPSSSDALVQTYNTDNIIANRIIGDATVDGVFELSDGSTVPYPYSTTFSPNYYSKTNQIMYDQNNYTTLSTTAGGTLNLAPTSGRVNVPDINLSGYMYFTGTGTHYIKDNSAVSGSDQITFRMANNTDTLTVGGTGFVGIGLTTPASLLNIGGDKSASSWTTRGLNFSVEANTLTDSSSNAATIATRAANSFGIPTFAFANATSTITNAATLYIAGAPTVDASSTIITNASALYVNGGTSYFGGKVGIGTTTPLNKLDVNGNIGVGSALNTTGNLIFYNSSNSNTVSLLAGATTPSSYALTLPPAQGGNSTTLSNDGSGVLSWVTPGAAAISIGSSITSGTPGSTLFVNSSGQLAQDNANYFWDASNHRLGIGTTSPYSLLSISNSATTAANTPLFTIASTTGGNSTSTLMTVLANGNVGIGTAAPAYQLEFAGNAKINGLGQINLYVAGAGVFGGYTSGTKINSYSASTPIIFSLNQAVTEVARFAGTTGNLGIGTTTPWAKLSIAALSSNTAPLFSISTSTASATSTAFHIDSNGLVGIGTSSPTTALQVNGVITPNTDNGSSLGNATYRWSAVYAANGTIQTSDQRLKSNITDLNYGLSDVLKLRPVSFIWTAQPSQGTQLGFIAQEVQPIVPETVNVGDDANHTLGLTYTEFIPMIVKAIQQLAHTITDFADSFTTKELTFVRATGDDLTLSHQLCIKKSDGTPVCVTGDQLAAALAGNSSSGSSSSATPGTSTSTTSDSPPTIEVTGNNPAHITIGSTYSDLGATITGPTEADTNLGIKIYVGTTPLEFAVIDTSVATTYHVYYIATNAAGTATSSRTVIVDAADIGTTNATTTDTTASDTTATTSEQ